MDCCFRIQTAVQDIPIQPRTFAETVQSAGVKKIETANIQGLARGAQMTVEDVHLSKRGVISVEHDAVNVPKPAARK